MDEISLPVVIHMYTIIPFLLGIPILILKKGTLVHKTMGRIWASFMMFTAIVSFWIRTDGEFGWIHILSVVALVSVASAVLFVRRGNVRAHMTSMIGAYIGSGVGRVLRRYHPGSGYAYDPPWRINAGVGQGRVVIAFQFCSTRSTCHVSPKSLLWMRNTAPPLNAFDCTEYDM